ncbi:MAG: HEPN domain-containing protein [Minisyncoccales bacterium]
MELNYNIYLERAENEIKIADISYFVSENKKIQKDKFRIEKPDTFYSAVISHSYYCIFYCAKAYLSKKGIKIKAPEEHKKTYEKFKKLALKGIVDRELLKIYSDAIIKADNLLNIFKSERKKRGIFTYQKLSQANKLPAKESLENSKLFFKIIYNLLK